MGCQLRLLWGRWSPSRNIIVSAEDLSVLSRKDWILAYARYACLNLYGVILHIDGYTTHFSYAIPYNDELLDAICWCMIRLLLWIWYVEPGAFCQKDQNEETLFYTHIDWC